MNEKSDLEEFFEESVEALRYAIINGHGNIPVLDPLTDLPNIKGHFKFGKKYLPHGDLELQINDAEVTGLKTIALSGKPTLDVENRILSFSLTLDELHLTSPSFAIDGDLKLLIKEREVSLDKKLSVKLKKVLLQLAFKFNLSGSQPVVVTDGTECEFEDIDVQIGHGLLAKLIVPWFKDRISETLSEKLAAALAVLLTEKAQAAYAAQGPTIGKMVDLYKMKVRQGGWAEDTHGPRLLEGFGGVGELPMPLLWKLPGVDVDHLEHQSVQEIMDNCKTGDVIMFSGTAASSQRIRRITQSPFSHAVVVIKEPEIADGAALIWQATSSTHRGVLRDMKPLPGIQVNYLDEMLRDYRSEAVGANIVYRPLTRPQRAADEEESYRQAVLDFIREMDSKPYTDDMDGLYVMGLLEVDNPDDADYFCAGIVAETLMRFGVLTRAFKQYQYAPRDFCTLQECLPFAQPGTSFGAEVVIDPE